MSMTILDTDFLFLWRLGMTLALAFLIGLEFHQYQKAEGQGIGFGTTRTLTLAGLLGFLLYALDESGWLFALGFGILALWLALYYKRRLEENYPSLIAPLVCLLVYLLGLLSWRAPQWFVVAYAILIAFFLSAKPRIRLFSDTVSGPELTTVAKFVIMAGVILPLLPDQLIASFIPITYQQTWLAVIAISGISYLSYVAQKYLFPSRGILATGLLGGLYSSTAATFVLARHAQKTSDNTLVSPALILASAMMYVRLLALAIILAPGPTLRLILPFTAAIVLSLLVALLLVRMQPRPTDGPHPGPSQHPLEFQMALFFAFLFVLFATVAQFIVSRYSGIGLEWMAFAVGFTEIDPFVLSLLTGHINISLHAAIDAVVIATASNNLLKAGLALGLARNRGVAIGCIWLVLLAVASFAYVLLWP